MKKGLIAIVVTVLLAAGLLGLSYTTSEKSSAGLIKCTERLLGDRCDVYLAPTMLPYQDNDPVDFNHLIDLLNTAEKYDTIRIHLNGFGGAVFLEDQIDMAIKNSKAKVITILDGNVYSAHAFLFLSAKHHEYTRLDYTFMVHLGNVCEQPQEFGRLDVKNQNIRIFGAVVKLLTKDELKSFLSCQDVYLTGNPQITFE